MANVPMTQKDSIVDQLEQLHQRIASRAYDLFRSRDGWGDAFGDWFSAEAELVSKPAVELREQDGTFTIAAALPGVDAKDITVDITPQDVVIKAATEHKHTENKGQVHRCEFTAGAVLPFAAVPEGRRRDQGESRLSERDAQHHRADRPRGPRQASRHQSRVDARPSLPAR